MFYIIKKMFTSMGFITNYYLQSELRRKNTLNNNNDLRYPTLTNLLNRPTLHQTDTNNNNNLQRYNRLNLTLDIPNSNNNNTFNGHAPLRRM